MTTLAATPRIHRRPQPAARGQFKARVHEWTEHIGVIPRRLQVQAMRRKWASRSTSRTIILSADLLREPANFQEVVVVHELLHLLMPNDGRVFRSFMKAYLPDWERVARGRTSRICGFQVLSSER
jgi:predicted metal-dependent hydrolase